MIKPQNSSQTNIPETPKQSEEIDPNTIPPDIMLMCQMAQFRTISESEFPKMLFDLPDLLEPSDKQLVIKQIAGVSRNLFLSTLVAVTLNVQLKNIKPLKIFQWPLLMRIAFRIPLSLFPYSFCLDNSMDKVEEFAKINRKYYVRFRKYQQTSDMKHIDPNGILQNNYQQKINRDSIEI